MKKKILLTGGGGAGNEAIWRILSDKYDLYFADCEIDNIDKMIPVEKRVRIPSASDANFIPRLIKVCRDIGLDFLVPSVDEELLLISKNSSLFPCDIFLPNTSFIETMIDKYVSMTSIRAQGLVAPETYHADEWERLKFPMIIKPTSGRGSRGVMVLKAKNELGAYKIFNPVPDKNLIVQKLIEGQEFTVFVSANKDGDLNCVIPVNVEQKRGVTISAVTEKNISIIDYVRSFHKKFNTSCIYNLQCILTSKNEVFPFEINPRVSTTFCMALAAGFDPFKSLGSKSQGLFYFDNNVRLKRNWKNNIST